jgi:D-3-phosphoglycerate dehydrogenase
MDILISEELDAPAIRRLGDKYKVVADGALWKNPAKLKESIAVARAIMVRNQTRLTADVLAAAPKLIGIGRVGVGLDNIDMPAANELGIVVIAPLDANATSVAELAFGFILALARKIPKADRSTKSGEWDRKNCTGMELDGKTLAICGFGRIGRKVAIFARAFGMKTIAYDPFVKKDSPALLETGASLAANFDEAATAADFISVHSPLTPETKHMFNSRVFALMKPGAFLINTSRGGVLDETALLEALRSGQLGGAALDVREKEPPVLSELEKMDNVIVAPHIAAFTVEAQSRTYEAVAADIDRLLSGHPPANPVNKPSRARYAR